MRRTAMPLRTWLVLSGTLAMSAAVLLAAACSDSRPSHRDATRPFFSGGGGEGGVTGDVYREVTIRDGGTPDWYEIGDTTVYAPLVDGWAFADSEVGVPSPLGVTTTGWDETGAFAGTDTTTDSLGDFHLIQYDAPAGTPPTLLRHYVNDTLFMETTQLWVQVDGGWVLTESYAETYVDGDTLSIWTSHSGEMASAHGSPVRRLTDVAVAPLRLLAPRPLQAQFYFWACRSEWIQYLAAVAATKALVATAVATRSWEAIELAIFAVAVAVDLANEVADCIAEQS